MQTYDYYFLHRSFTKIQTQILLIHRKQIRDIVAYDFYKEKRYIYSLFFIFLLLLLLFFSPFRPKVTLQLWVKYWKLHQKSDGWIRIKIKSNQYTYFIQIFKIIDFSSHILIYFSRIHSFINGCYHFHFSRQSNKIVRHSRYSVNSSLTEYQILKIFQFWFFKNRVERRFL